MTDATRAAEEPPPTEWELSFGGIEEDNCHKAIATRDGGFLLAGDTRSDVSGTKTSSGFGGMDCWAVRVDAQGNQLWDESFGGSGAEMILTAAPARDDGFLLAGWSDSGVSGNKTAQNYGREDFWIINVDASGRKVWDKTFGGSNMDFLTAMLPLSDGGFLLGGDSLSGASGSKTSRSYGGSDLWLVRIDAAGTKLWENSFGGSGQEGGDPPASPLAIVPSGDGGFLLGSSSDSSVSGNKTAASFGSFDYWLVKLDSDGNKVWDRAYGGRSGDFLTGIAPAGDGGFLLAGHSFSGISGTKTTFLGVKSEAWVVKVDANGNKLWDRSYGGAGENRFLEIVALGDGTFLLAGNRACDPLCGDSNFWLVKIDAGGAILWEQTFGGSGADELTGLTVSSDGGILLSGASNSFDLSSPNNGSDDFWAIKLDGPPKIAIERAGSRVRLTWPLTVKGYRIEQLQSLEASPGAPGWSPMPGPYENDGFVNTVTVSPLGEGAIYRLRKP